MEQTTRSGRFARILASPILSIRREVDNIATTTRSLRERGDVLIIVLHT
jgi:hypothetical protein